MLIESVAAFLAIAIVFYALFAGADFGAGILLLLLPRERRADLRHVVDRAIGPVWEANHVWLILAVVILFNGFPRAYASVSTVLHIPITLMLVGIVLRGTAFTFRHYDVVRDKTQRAYLRVFTISSLLTPFMFGVIAAGLVTWPPAQSMRFYARYLAPVLTPFAAAMGVFACTLFAFLAAVYLIGETTDEALRAVFAKRARQLFVAAVLVGATVVLTGRAGDVPIFRGMFRSPLAIGFALLATLLVLPLLRSLKTAARWRPRVVAALQVACVLGGWVALQYPYIVVGHGVANGLTLQNAAAPARVMRLLLAALGVGSFLIFPALFYLFRVFKRSMDGASS